MLTLTVPGDEYFDDDSQSFSTIGDVVLQLEHSLVSLSKWEEFYEKPFLGSDEKTQEEVMKYIEFMIITPDFPRGVISRFTNENYIEVDKYINSKHTATWFSDLENKKGPHEIITAELIYYWMISMKIPFECQHWHLNRLFTLIRVISVKNEKPKKMTRGEIAARNRALNEQRRAQYNTKG